MTIWRARRGTGERTFTFCDEHIYCTSDRRRLKQPLVSAALFFVLFLRTALAVRHMLVRKRRRTRGGYCSTQI